LLYRIGAIKREPPKLLLSGRLKPRCEQLTKSEKPVYEIGNFPDMRLDLWQSDDAK